MRRGARLMLAGVTALTLTLPATAQPRPVPPVTVIEMDSADLVEGTLDGPDGTSVTVPRRPRFGSFIQLRADFRAELLDSVSEL